MRKRKRKKGDTQKKREFGGLFLEAEHALEFEVREKKKDSKKGIFFLRRRLLAR